MVKKRRQDSSSKYNDIIRSNETIRKGSSSRLLRKTHIVKMIFVYYNSNR